MDDYDKMQFYDDMHSHHYEHPKFDSNCEMCKLLSLYKYHRYYPSEWKPPRKDGRLDGDKIEAYIKGLQS